jgi:hypothetical protein
MVHAGRSIALDEDSPCVSIGNAILASVKSLQGALRSQGEVWSESNSQVLRRDTRGKAVCNDQNQPASHDLGGFFS